MLTFGDVVKALRTADHLTLEQVAKKIRSHKGYVSGIENDKVAPPSVKILTRLQKAFAGHGIALEDLVELAWVSKAPVLIRERELERIQKTNPLLQIEMSEAKVVLPPPAPASEVKEAV